MGAEERENGNGGYYLLQGETGWAGPFFAGSSDGEGRLGRLGLHSLERRRMRSDLIEMYKIIRDCVSVGVQCRLTGG